MCGSGSVLRIRIQEAPEYGSNNYPDPQHWVQDRRTQDRRMHDRIDAKWGCRTKEWKWRNVENLSREGIYRKSVTLNKLKFFSLDKHFLQCCGAGPFFDRLRVFFSPAPAPIKSTGKLSTILIFYNNIPCSLLEKIHLFSRISFLISINSMLERTERISFRISSFYLRWSRSREPDLHTGSGFGTLIFYIYIKLRKKYVYFKGCCSTDLMCLQRSQSIWPSRLSVSVSRFFAWSARFLATSRLYHEGEKSSDKMQQCCGAGVADTKLVNYWI